MSQRDDIMEELHALKREAAQALTSSAEEWRQISSRKAQSLAAEVQGLAAAFRDALAQDEAEIERAVEGRVAQALVTALVTGIAIGWFIRRRP